jgi:hypothetical protein
MNKNRRRHLKGATLLLAGGMLLGIEGTCIPKDYFYNLGGQARNSLFENVSELLVMSLFDALNIPDNNNGDNGDNGDNGNGPDPDDSPSPIG